MENNIALPNSVVAQLQNVYTGYNEKTQTKVVSQNLNVEITKGELISLIGANGCGKSTLLRSIGGIQSLVSGTILMGDGSDLHKIPTKERAKYRSLVLTDRIESSNLTVLDIVSNGRYPYLNFFGSLTRFDKDIIKRSLEVCFLQGWEDRIYSNLSDGEKQKVLIARALSQDTPLMILDEVTAHLDLPNRIEVIRMLNLLAKETEKAILISSHELDLAMQWSDSIWLMNKNGYIYDGIPEEIVLSGKLSEVFCNKDIGFDMQTGQFKSCHSKTKSIQLIGSGVNRIWTQKALERIGFNVLDRIDNSVCIIEIKANKWIVNNKDISHEYNSLTEVIKYIKPEL